MKLEGSPQSDAGILADHLPAPPTDNFSPPQRRHLDSSVVGMGSAEPRTAAKHSSNPSIVYATSSPSPSSSSSAAAAMWSSHKSNVLASDVVVAAGELGRPQEENNQQRYPRSISQQRQMKSAALSPGNSHSAPRASFTFRLPPIAAWKESDEERIGRQVSIAHQAAIKSNQFSPPPATNASSPPLAFSSKRDGAGKGSSPNDQTTDTFFGAGRRRESSSTSENGGRSSFRTAMAYDDAAHRYPSPSYGYQRQTNEGMDTDGATMDWNEGHGRRASLQIRTSPYEQSANDTKRRSPLPPTADSDWETSSSSHQDRKASYGGRHADTLPSMNANARTTSPEARLPRLPSLRHLSSQAPHSAPPISESSRLHADAFPRREEPATLYHSSSEPRLPLTAQQPPKSASHQNSRASSFMASLLRAAQSPETGGAAGSGTPSLAAVPSPATVNSPMSVHSIVEGRALSPQTERRTRKRRTSSVQEPLQGSALEAATRAQSFPRRSEHSTSHHRTGGSTIGSDYAVGRIGVERSPPHFERAPASAVSRSHLQQQAEIQSPMSDSARFPRFDAPDVHLRHHKWQSDELRRASPYVERTTSPHHPTSAMSSGHYEPSYSPSHGPHRSQAYSGYDGYRRAQNSGGAESVSLPPSSEYPYGYNNGERHPAYHDRTPLSAAQESLHVRHSYGGAKSAPSMQQSMQPIAISQSHHTGALMMQGGGGGGGGGGVSVESIHWNADLASRAWNEQERWARLSLNDRRQQVLQSIWDARTQIGSTTSYWPPQASNVTTIRCMYANIAQKSYGTEKRFLCPPPVVKISGPLRPCKWVTMRVTLGDSAMMPNSGSVSGGGLSGALGTVAGGEEQAILDGNCEARFGKLHVGSVSDASASKVFRLQINLLRAETIIDDAKQGGVQRAIQEISGPLNLPSHAWATFHSSPINVISKPARKSVRTRAASPAIASGSVVCLYNRLNSQTVRTKYLGVESGSISDVDHHGEVARRLIARQEGWEGFSIELLARPLHDPAVARVKARGVSSEEWGITYGSIVCLRDVNSKLCSDPMLICKVDKGRVELSSVTGESSNGGGKVRFQIVSKNRQEAREILFGGARKSIAGSTMTWSPAATQQKGERGQREGSQASSSNNDSPLATAGKVSTAAAAADASGSMGGPVIQMQKVTLMHVVPKPSAHSPDEVECDLSSPRAYLCSTASESQRADEPIRPVLARSALRMRIRSDVVLRAGGNEEPPLDEADAPVATTNGSSPGQTGGGATVAEGTAAATQAGSSTVGFTCPPTASTPVTSSNAAASTSGQIDFLEDQFCWTIVTISCTEVSYIDANSPPSADGKQQAAQYPHIPCSPLPVTPFPCLAAQPTYDVRSHSISATIHDFLLADGLDGARHMLNTVSAVHAVPNKVAHDVWLGHSGPLPARASSAGPYMSDVTVQLPTMSELAALHVEFHGLSSSSPVVDQLNVIQLPLLFVRLAQGITFPSGHWLLAERGSTATMINNRLGSSHAAWTIRVV